MKKNESFAATCPRCGLTYHDRPALSRLDNETLICPDCGTREALEGLGIGKDEQDEILAAIHRCYNNQH